MDSPSVSNVVRKVLFRDSVQFCSDLVDLVAGVSCRVAVSSVPDALLEILIASRRPLAVQVFTAIENLFTGCCCQHLHCRQHLHLGPATLGPVQVRLRT